MEVWNIGLPRTGTTSVGEALRKLGFTHRPAVAHWVAEQWSSKQPGLFVPREVPDDVMLVCSVRDGESWLASAKHWRPNLRESDLEATLYAHGRWFGELGMSRAIGLFNVIEGHAGLLHALSVAAHDPLVQYPLPLLNQRAA